MGHLDQVEYRAPAKRIIEAEFKSTSTLYRDYMGRYHHETGNDVEAKRLYDDLFNSYDGTEFIPWMNLGNFYRDTGDYERALECFERSRNRIGEEHAIVERSHEGESYLDRQILELREKIAQKQRQ